MYIHVHVGVVPTIYLESVSKVFFFEGGGGGG